MSSPSSKAPEDHPIGFLRFVRVAHMRWWLLAVFAVVSAMMPNRHGISGRLTVCVLMFVMLGGFGLIVGYLQYRVQHADAVRKSRDD